MIFCLRSYRAYRVRKYLAARHWNFHLGRASTTNKSGSEITSPKNNQQTKQWDLRTFKAAKTYEYIPLLIARILHSRMEDNDIITRNMSLNVSDPRLLAPTIAASPLPKKKPQRKYCNREDLVCPPRIMTQRTQTTNLHLWSIETQSQSCQIIVDLIEHVCLSISQIC